jgi:hypothetical protein
MRWVFEELARLGVSPVGQESEPKTGDRGDGLREAVVRRAWTMMQERGWVPRPDPQPEAPDVDVDVAASDALTTG